MFQIVELTLFSHWASALINDDFSGLSDEEAVIVNDFMIEFDFLYCVDVKDDNHFTNTHDMHGGMAGDCSTFIFHRPFGANEPITPMQKAVAEWLADTDQWDLEYGPEGRYKDLQHGGCISGMADPVTTYADTTAFYAKHQKEIDALLYEAMLNTGATIPQTVSDLWDDEDPLGRCPSNQNLLAWYGWERAADYLMQE